MVAEKDVTGWSIPLTNSSAYRLLARKRAGPSLDAEGRFCLVGMDCLRKRCQ